MVKCVLSELNYGLKYDSIINDMHFNLIKTTFDKSELDSLYEEIKPLKDKFIAISTSFISLLFLISTLQLLLPYVQYLEAQQEEEVEQGSCILYDSSNKIITLNCNSIITLTDIDKQLNDPQILHKEENTLSDDNVAADKGKAVWVLNAGIVVGENTTLYINNTDTSWLKIVADGETAYPIEVEGRAKIDSVKITSWDPETNDFVNATDDGLTPRPYLRIAKAQGPIEIINSEIAYLGYGADGCSGCGGLGFYGGDGHILKGNHIHHIWKGVYSRGIGGMIIEDNHVHNNNLYGIDPHSGTHDMMIRNNTVHDNGSSGIICSKDCYNITIEGNEVYNNDDNGRGIMLSINMYDSVIRNNLVYDQGRCISMNEESNNNQIYANVLSDCSEVGISAYEDANNNKIYNNTIMNSIVALAAEDDAYDNAFYSNTIVNSTEFDITDDNEDSDTSSDGNTFENNIIS